MSFLLAYVVPEIVTVFDNIDQQLPWLTIALITVSDFLRENYLLLIGLIAVAGGGFAYLQHQPASRKQLHRLWLRLPVISRLVRGINTSRFARTLSILAASGVPVLEALQISAQVVTNLPMRSAVEEATQRVREGANLATSLEHSGYFPPMVTNLIASGEVSGNLEEMLERAAVNQERELETLVATLMGLMEPLLIVVMGGVVLIIVLAILLPIFDLNQLVR